MISISLIIQALGLLIIPCIIWIAKLLYSIINMLKRIESALYGSDDNPNHQGVLHRTKENEERSKINSKRIDDVEHETALILGDSDD